jgi:hypothetical protein
MAQSSRPAVPGWYWAVAVLALLWEAGGCYAYLTQVSAGAKALAALTPAERAVWQAMPPWIWGAYAVAVWVGLSGAIGLLMRQPWARAALIVSLAGVVVQFGWLFLRTDMLAAKGPSATILPAAIFIVGLFLIWFASLAGKTGWLR